MKIVRDKGRVNALNTMYPCLATLDTKFDNVIYDSTVYGYCFGPSTLEYGDATYPLFEGSYFCLTIEDRRVPKVKSDDLVFAVIRVGFRGVFQIGHAERKGRLSYIDGCSDSLLVYPPRRGDPSLNLLYFPKGIDQTRHTHPSIRIGVVISGSGYSYVSGQHDNLQLALETGSMFYLEEHEPHFFSTRGCTDGMRIVAFHPDGDWGPEDHNHTMLNRTYMK